EVSEAQKENEQKSESEPSSQQEVSPKPEAEPQEKATQVEEPVAEKPEEDDSDNGDDDDFDIGVPALVTHLSKKAADKKVKRPDVAKAKAVTTTQTVKPEKLTLTFVQEQWPVFLESLKDE